MRVSTIFLFLLIFGINSCNIGPKPIAYGSDGCHFCKMTIVDQQHAAQLVTKKGKVYKYDASECMLNQLPEFKTEDIALLLVNDYDNPGKLIDATTATFLISENIPSPMGEFLSAFKSKEVAKKTQMENGGELFTWEELKKRFNYTRIDSF